MNSFIYSKTTDKNVQSFYLVFNNKDYFLFAQKYFKGVKNYFYNKVLLNDAFDFAKSNHDNALMRTMKKLPLYIKYIEREYGIQVLKSTIKKNEKTKSKISRVNCNVREYYAS